MQDGSPQPLLPAISSKHLGRKCLVLDLDETLVHSSLRVSSVAQVLQTQSEPDNTPHSPFLRQTTLYRSKSRTTGTISTC